MNTLMGIAGLLVVAAITPGPNNLIVMRISARSGLLNTLPAIGGVVSGGLALLAMVTAGVGTLFASEPRLRVAVTIAGCACLGWLAVDLIRRRPAHRPEPWHASTTTGFTGLFVFQLLNPKGWLMLLTAVSAMTAADIARTFALVAALFVPASLVCLLTWALFGTLLTRYLERPQIRVWFDRVTGGLLLVMAAVLLSNIRPGEFSS